MEYIRESRRPPGRLKGGVWGGGAPPGKIKNPQLNQVGLKGRVLEIAPEGSPARDQRVHPAQKSPGLLRAQQKVFHETYTMVIHSKMHQSIIHQLEKWKICPGHLFGNVSPPTSVFTLNT